MAVNLKCVFIFRAAEGYGWTEVHYWQSASDNPNLLTRITNMRNVVGPARAQLLGAGCDLVGLRASYPRAGEIASLGEVVFIDGPDDQPSADQSSSIAVSFIDSTSTKKKICHLRGFWDNVAANQLYQPDSPLAPGWGDRFIAWKQTLIEGGYGWLTVSAGNSSRGAVTNYAAGLDERITFTVALDGGPALVAGQIGTFRFSKLNNSKSTLNRDIICTVVNPTTLLTLAPIAAFPFTAQGRFKLRSTTFVGYANTATIRLGERRMGAPLDRYPGRHKAKARG